MSEAIDGCESTIHVFAWGEEYPDKTEPPPDWPCQCGARTWGQSLRELDWPETALWEPPAAGEEGG
jgi:hypothetical protein